MLDFTVVMSHHRSARKLTFKQYNFNVFGRFVNVNFMKLFFPDTLHWSGHFPIELYAPFYIILETSYRTFHKLNMHNFPVLIKITAHLISNQFSLFFSSFSILLRSKYVTQYQFLEFVWCIQFSVSVKPEFMERSSTINLNMDDVRDETRNPKLGFTQYLIPDGPEHLHYV